MKSAFFDLKRIDRGTWRTIHARVALEEKHANYLQR